MAITWNGANNGEGVDTDTVSFSVTVNSGANIKMLLAYGCEDPTPAPGISSANFNGSESFTKINEMFFASNNMKVEWWYLDDPTVTTANVNCILTAAANDSAFSILILNNGNTGNAEAWAANNGQGLTCNCSITTLGDSSWILDQLVGNNTTAAASNGANMTVRTSDVGAGVEQYTSTRWEPFADEYTDTWTYDTGNPFWGMALLSIGERGAAPPGPDTTKVRLIWRK